MSLSELERSQTPGPAANSFNLAGRTGISLANPRSSSFLPDAIYILRGQTCGVKSTRGALRAPSDLACQTAPFNRTQPT